MDDSHIGPDLYSPHPPDKQLFLTDAVPTSKLTHNLFRYPAKFHPPVARALLARFTNPGEAVLDPFVGSGTILLEAAVSKRHSIGIDVDPVAIEVADAKTRLYDLDLLDTLSRSLSAELVLYSRTPEEYEKYKFDDLTEQAQAEELSQHGLELPKIPNMTHWFRRYVSVDLAIILSRVNVIEDATARAFFRIVFASIIRNSSNADPVPVSGLEVTSHMKKRDEVGRIVNPFQLFAAALRKARKQVGDLVASSSPDYAPTIIQADATNLRDALNSVGINSVSAVLTSPPYHNAVDYYRRHQLEMFWLDHTKTQAERLEILPRYIGRHRIPQKNPLIMKDDWEPSSLTRQWYDQIRQADVQRATDFRHYMTSMQLVFDELQYVLPAGAPAVFVVGNSTWRGQSIPTDQLFAEIAGEHFRLEDTLWYPVKNRYMSYTRRNGADISRELVVILRRR